MREADERRRALLANVETEDFTHREIFQRDGWTCGICELPVDPAEVWPEPGFGSLGHIVPLIKGGPHTRGNVRLEHLYCNLVKNQKLDHQMF